MACSLVLDTLLNSSRPELPPAHPFFLRHLSIDASAKPRLYLSAALSPFGGVTYTDKRAKVHPAVEAVVRESMKLGSQNHYVDGIPALFLSIEPFQKLLRDYPDFGAERLRSSIGPYNFLSFSFLIC